MRMEEIGGEKKYLIHFEIVFEFHGQLEARLELVRHEACESADDLNASTDLYCQGRDSGSGRDRRFSAMWRVPAPPK